MMQRGMERAERGRTKSLAFGLALALTPSLALYDCPKDKIQDAYRISVSKKDKHYGCCSQVCLSPGLRNVAGKHGVRYGSSCINEGCVDFILEDSNAGQHFYLFKCPDAVIQAQLPSPRPPPTPSPPSRPPSPPAPSSPPPAPSPPPFIGERPRNRYTVKYTDMACGELLATRVQNLEACALIAKRHGNHFFSYNQWWKFCLACEASELAQCDEPVVDVVGCHYQVRAGRAAAAAIAQVGGAREQLCSAFCASRCPPFELSALQVGFAIYQQAFGGPSADLAVLPGVSDAVDELVSDLQSPGGLHEQRRSLSSCALSLVSFVLVAAAVSVLSRRRLRRAPPLTLL